MCLIYIQVLSIKKFKKYYLSMKMALKEVMNDTTYLMPFNVHFAS